VVGELGQVAAHCQSVNRGDDISDEQGELRRRVPREGGPAEAAVEDEIGGVAQRYFWVG
jgi:hypothetical protein